MVRNIVHGAFLAQYRVLVLWWFGLVQVKCSKGRYRKILKIIHPSVVTTLIANLLKLHSSLYLPPRGPKLFHPQCLNLAKIFINPRFCADRTLDPSLPLLDLFPSEVSKLFGHWEHSKRSIIIHQSVIVFMHWKLQHRHDKNHWKFSAAAIAPSCCPSGQIAMASVEF